MYTSPGRCPDCCCHTDQHTSCHQGPSPLTVRRSNTAHSHRNSWSALWLPTKPTTLFLRGNPTWPFGVDIASSHRRFPMVYDGIRRSNKLSPSKRWTKMVKDDLTPSYSIFCCLGFHNPMYTYQCITLLQNARTYSSDATVLECVCVCTYQFLLSPSLR